VRCPHPQRGTAEFLSPAPGGVKVEPHEVGHAAQAESKGDPPQDEARAIGWMSSRSIHAARSNRTVWGSGATQRRSSV
jgi:hypothetical protein